MPTAATRASPTIPTTKDTAAPAPTTASAYRIEGTASIADRRSASGLLPAGSAALRAFSTSGLVGAMRGLPSAGDLHRKSQLTPVPLTDVSLATGCALRVLSSPARSTPYAGQRVIASPPRFQLVSWRDSPWTPTRTCTPTTGRDWSGYATTGRAIRWCWSVCHEPQHGRIASRTATDASASATGARQAKLGPVQGARQPVGTSGWWRPLRQHSSHSRRRACEGQATRARQPKLGP
jgi:hypothetical protein